MSLNHRGVIISIAILMAIGMSLHYAGQSGAQSGGRGTVVLKITGFSSARGQVKIAVFNSPEQWLDKPVYSNVIDVESPEVLWKINDVPYGDYGIAVFHDENKNGKMDKNFLGIPLEAYGFSNNVRVTFGPPKWDKAKFAVSSSNKEVRIEVK